MSDYARIAQLFRRDVADDRSTRLITNGASTWFEDDDLVNIDSRSTGFKTDFEQLLEDMAVSHFGPNGEPLDELAQKVQLREIKRARDEVSAPSISTVPKSWDSGVLGGEVTLQPNQNTALAGEKRQVVFWTGEERESTALTVTVRPLGLPDTVGGSSVIRPVAEIIWGTRGQFRAEIDIGTGIELTLTGSSIYVNAFLDTGSTTQLKVEAGIGFHAAYTHNPAVRTAYLDNIGTAAPVTTLRAPFGGTIVGFERADMTAAYRLQFLDIAGNVMGTRVIASATYLTQPIVLPNDCRFVTVLNQGAGADNARLIYGVM